MTYNLLMGTLNPYPTHSLTHPADSQARGHGLVQIAGLQQQCAPNECISSSPSQRHSGRAVKFSHDDL